MSTHYEVLGVAEDAPLTAIKAAWRRLAVASHPDRNPDDPDAERRFKAASLAWQVLSDPTSRSNYDDELYWDRQPKCVVCGEPARPSDQLCEFCALNLHFTQQAERAQQAARRAEVHRVPPTAYEAHQARVEAEYGWMGNPDNFDRMMGREPGYYDTFGSVSSDDLLQALLSEAALRSAGYEHAEPWISLEAGSDPGVRIRLSTFTVTIDKGTLRALRQVQGNLGVLDSLLRNLKEWWR